MLRKPVPQVPSEALAREKLAICVYEYLHHQGAHKAAQVFLSEIGWEKNIEIGDTPFLSSWWSVFWDLYCAAPERRDHNEHSAEARAFHDYGYGNCCSRVPQPSNCVQGFHGAPMMMMPRCEMLGPHGQFEFTGPVGHMHGCLSPNSAMQFGSGLAGPHGVQLPVYAGSYPYGVRLVGVTPPQSRQSSVGFGLHPQQQPNSSSTAYGSITSPQHAQLGGPPSVQSVQSNSAFSSAGQPQTVCNTHPGRPSPWRTPNGASSYCTSPYAASSLPESIGAPPNGSGAQLGSMVAQADGLGSMLLGDSEGLLNTDISQMFNDASSPRGDDASASAGGATAAYLNGSFGDCGFTAAPTIGAPSNARRADALENTAAAILKIKESMREEAKRFETSDAGSLIVQSSN